MKRYELEITVQGEPPARLLRLLEHVAGRRRQGDYPIRHTHRLWWAFPDGDAARAAEARLTRSGLIIGVEYCGPVEC